MDINPWQVDSIQEFSFLKCPECAFDSKEEDTFENHAIENHPLSYILFVKLVKEECFENPLQIKEENLDVNIASKKRKLSQPSAHSEGINIKSIKVEPESSVSGSGAYLGDESYGASIANGEFERFDFYQERNEFDNSMVAAGGSGFGVEGKRPRKTYTINIKLNAIREAERTSNRKVASILGVDEKTIRHWRKSEEQLIQSKANLNFENESENFFCLQ